MGQGGEVLGREGGVTREPARSIAADTRGPLWVIRVGCGMSAFDAVDGSSTGT